MVRENWFSSSDLLYMQIWETKQGLDSIPSNQTVATDNVSTLLQEIHGSLFPMTHYDANQT